jgi:peptidoglycan-associated lipoprotein
MIINSSAVRVALVGALLTVGGCAAKPEEATPLPEIEPSLSTSGPVVSDSSSELASFDDNGYPYRPGTDRLLERTFYFDYDRALLRPEALAILELHAEALRAHPERMVVIEGHADERGSREYNLALGERRAHAIRKFLLAAGVSRGQLQTVSYGEERPEVTGTSETSWSRNRRALLDYSAGSADTFTGKSTVGLR